MSNIDWDKLHDAAKGAAANSYSPYSKFPVGAALLSEDGTVDCGTNVENACYPLGICAEHSAITTAVTRGQRRFRAIAIYSEATTPASPCGKCRQILAEFALDLPVRSYAPDGSVFQATVRDLLPAAFTAAQLPIDSNSPRS